ncbi:LytR/AlgR family response regulator transcription factor [Autumnicola edwardsiae]|uniref:LytTR family DNA-binding domain-containing protein n=1 Tax=Autumnicola edwardsiae TaxID=3075594 RepID=A0ABU3CV84_9FLAO|nr:LytTR family DNA-binding domain-containing protein [Zunongwangia sp. F297]MDT0650272.1 LytTR family DNA-binding domain-containing protein [Zunongwangia sp. F297]
MQALIIEDEKPSARRLQRMLEKQKVNVIATLHAVEEATEWFLQNEHPDIIFLDIQLSDGLSFEIFENVEIRSAIIFTTAYDEYALKAFKLNSVDYLLKPIDDEELAAALQKFYNNSAAFKGGLSMQNLQSIFNLPTSEYRKRFTVQIGQHIKLINVEEISCFCSENKSTYIHTLDKRHYPLEISLEKLENELNPENFFRINRQSIVNISAIEDIIAYSNSRLRLSLKSYNDFPLIVSREKVKDFKQWLS